MKALQTNIYFTDSCNRNCPGCYHPHGPVSTHMTVDMASKITEWIGNLCREENVELYKCHCLGGEPFENKEVFFHFIEKLKENLPETTKGHPDGQFLVFTNGDYLDVPALYRCKFHNIYIMLNPVTDDLMTVHEKMHFIKSICGGVSLSVVANEFNLPRLTELTQLAIDHNAHIRINRLYDGGRSEEYITEYGKAFHKVFDLLLVAQKPMWPNFILESTYPLWEGPKNPHACGRWLLVIDQDGTVRSCNADMGTKIGHIDTHHKMSDFVFTHRWSSKNLSECKGCEWANGGLCQGGCPTVRKYTHGTYDKPTPFCRVYKTLFPRLKNLVDKYNEYNKKDKVN